MKDEQDGHSRVMVDIETLGLEPGCAILSIGAVEFGPHGLGEEFYQNVDLPSCQEAGLTIDAGTLDWWLGQDADAQHVLTGGMRLSKALWQLSSFYRDADEIWAYSPSFDCEILKAGYEATDMTPAWTYQEERCARTIANLDIAPELDRDGTEHDALDDAKHQARVVSSVLEWVGEE